MQDDAMETTAGAGNVTTASPMDLYETPVLDSVSQGARAVPLSRCLPATLAVAAPAPAAAAGNSNNCCNRACAGVSVAAMVHWIRTSLGPTDLNNNNNNRNKNGGLGGSLSALGGGARGGGGGGDVPMFAYTPNIKPSPTTRCPWECIERQCYEENLILLLSLLQTTGHAGSGSGADAGSGESESGENAGGDRNTSNNTENNTTTTTTTSFRVLDCHDAVVYCLAPLDYAIISCCTDCVIILGAAGKAVRVERCERVQVVVTAQHVVINTCHDCIFYLTVNRPPVLLGDNRFVQLAPHNAGYDHLENHVIQAGVRVVDTAWSNVTLLLPDQHQHAAATEHHNGFLAGGGSYGSSPPSNNAFNFNTSGGNGGDSLPAGSSSPITLSLSPLKMPSPRSPALAALSSPPGAAALGAAAAAAVASSPLSSSGASPGSEPRQDQQTLYSNNNIIQHHHGGVAHPPSASFLPPSKLLPFLVPFTGGKGPLCGGPVHPRSSSSNTAAANAAGGGGGTPAVEEDLLGGLLGGAGTHGAEAFGPIPFPLTAEYAASWEERMNGMTAVRSAYRHAGLDDVRKREFIGAIQANFKEWLQAGSGMRMKEVYDLARAEKEEAQSLLGGGGGSGS